MASTLRRLGRNLRWLVASEVSSRILGFLFIALSARTLGLEKLGTLTLCLVYSEAFQLVASFSLQDVLIKNAARDREELPTQLSGILWIQGAAVVPCLGLAWILGLLYGGEFSTLLVLAGGLGWVRALAKTWLSVRAAREDFRPTALYGVLERLAGFLALGVYVTWMATLAAWMAVLILGSVLTLGYAVASAKQDLPGRLQVRVQGATLRALLREGFGFSMLRWIGLAHNRLDTILVERLLNSEALGIYAVAYRLFEVFKIVPNIAERALFPVMAGADFQGRRLAEGMGRFIKSLTLVTIPLAMGAWVLADPIIRLVFGNDFLEAAEVWPVLMVALVGVSITRPFLVLVRTQGRLRAANLVFLVTTLVGLGMNLWLLPRIGVIGAAVTTLLTEVFLLSSMWTITRDLVPFSSVTPVLRVVGVGVVIAAVMWWVPDSLPWLTLGLALPAYAGGLLLVGALDRQDWQGVREMVGKVT